MASRELRGAILACACALAALAPIASACAASVAERSAATLACNASRSLRTFSYPSTSSFTCHVRVGSGVVRDHCGSGSDSRLMHMHCHMSAPSAVGATATHIPSKPARRGSYSVRGSPRFHPW